MNKASEKPASIILASQSSRRVAILKQVGINFTVMKSDAEEEMSLNDSTPKKLAIENARRKALDVAKRVPQGIILGSDTIIFFKNVIFGKPKDKKDAAAMLSSFSGTWHDVITGIALVKKHSGVTKIRTSATVTKVYVRSLGKEEIDSYVQTGEPLDKAGSYGINEKGATIIEKIHGDYYNVVGLPLQALLALAKKMGIRLL